MTGSAHFSPFEGFRMHGAVGCSALDEGPEGDPQEALNDIGAYRNPTGPLPESHRTLTGLCRVSQR
ncbi:MAG: hypothetical protein WCF36_11285 [Candidatus Nanopelagicales bacterium]